MSECDRLRAVCDVAFEVQVFVVPAQTARKGGGVMEG